MRISFFLIGIALLAHNACSRLGDTRMMDSADASVVTVTDESSAQAELGNRVRFKGTAGNAKISAVVRTDRLTLYCVENPEWPSSLAGKTLLVTGILEKTDRFKTGSDAAGTESDVFVLKSVTHEAVD